jgi:hypothetical protein
LILRRFKIPDYRSGYISHVFTKILQFSTLFLYVNNFLKSITLSQASNCLFTAVIGEGNLTGILTFPILMLVVISFQYYKKKKKEFGIDSWECEDAIYTFMKDKVEVFKHSKDHWLKEYNLLQYQNLVKKTKLPI